MRGNDADRRHEQRIGCTDPAGHEHEPAMTHTTPEKEADHPPIQCLLELHYNGTVSVTAKRGCSEEEIRDLLHQLAGGMWLGGVVDGATARRDVAA